MSATATQLTVVAPKMGFGARLKRIWQYRELFIGLVKKELKVKYKDSVLGFVWSMLNPALYLVVFYIVFQVFLNNPIKNFPIFLLSGLLVWNLFSSAVPAGCGSVVGNSSIIKKVAFPREILPMASVGASLVHFFLQSIVLIGALILFQWHVSWPEIPMLIPAILTLLLFTGALAVFFSAVNVYLRDSQHLLELLLLAWFWVSPIVYQYKLVSDKVAQHGWPSWLPFLNPITVIVVTFQRVIYNPTEQMNILPMESNWWYLTHLAVVALVSVVLLVLAIMIFGRLEGNFAEEL